MVVLIGCAVLVLLRAGVRETCKCGFFKEMTRWIKMRTIVSLCSQEGGGGWCEVICYAGRRGGNRGGGGKGACWSVGGGGLNVSRIVSGRLGGRSSG